MKKWEGKFLATTNWPQATKIEKCILDRQLAPVLKVHFGPVPGWQITFTISGY